MNWADLRQQMITALNEEELRTLCFDLNVDFDNLPGRNKASKIRELIDLMRRNGRLPQLITQLQQIRPSLTWQLPTNTPPVRSAAQRNPTPPNGRRLLLILSVGGLLLLAVLLLLTFRNLLTRSDNSGEATAVATAPADTAACLDTYLADIPAERRTSIEVGETAHDLKISSEDSRSTSLTPPFGIILMRGGTAVAALQFSLRAKETIFKILSVVDAACQPIPDFHNGTRTNAIDLLQDDDFVLIPLANSQLTLRMGFQGTQIRFSFREIE